MARRLSKMFERRKVEKTYLALVQGWLTIETDNSNSVDEVLEIHAPIRARSKEQGEWWKMCVATTPIKKDGLESDQAGHHSSSGQKSATTQVRVLQRGYLTACAFDIQDDPCRIPTLPSSVTSELIPRGTSDSRYWLPPVDKKAGTQKEQKQDDRRAKATLVMLTPLTGRRHQLRVHLQHIGHPIIGDFHYQAPMTPTSRMMLHAWRIGFPIPRYHRHLSSLASVNSGVGDYEEGRVSTSLGNTAGEERDGIFVECPHPFHRFLDPVQDMTSS
ncbi:RNA pseudouridylate synthase domain-containing protein 1 [Actinomortierella ambigua]|nr:RNA pseudouridylate synthase domain-containing protein 1 [Actinomortierella ambigua]